VEREMALVHVTIADAATRQEVLNLIRRFRARVIRVSETSITVEATGERNKVDELLHVLRSFGIEEMVRAGTIAIKQPARIDSPSAKQEPAVC
jgi:acetolactate synthase-1/3 small subunit